MDYLAFLDDIDKIWTEERNSKIARDYSMNRSVLPALIKLHREWTDVFNRQSEDYDALELELNFYKNNKDLVSNVELSKKIEELKNVVTELQEENYQYEKKIRVLEDENYHLKHKTLFQKLVG